MDLNEPVHENGSHLLIDICLLIHVAYARDVVALSVYHVSGALFRILWYQLRIIAVVIFINLAQLLIVLHLGSIPKLLKVQELLLSSQNRQLRRGVLTTHDIEVTRIHFAVILELFTSLLIHLLVSIYHDSVLWKWNMRLVVMDLGRKLLSQRHLVHLIISTVTSKILRLVLTRAPLIRA